jgi:hypothetical protein
MSFPARIRFLHLPVLLLPFFFVLGVRSQATTAPIATETQSVRVLNGANIEREIDDPSSGARWLLVRGTDRPGGPGRLVLIPARYSVARSAELGELPAGDSYVLVIHAGDTLVVAEHTAIADARLEAVALGPARSGAPLCVRLKLGGRILHAIASGPGRAILTTDSEAWQ